MRILPACVLCCVMFAPVAPATPQGRGRLSLPNKDWGLILDLNGFSIEQNGTKPDGRRYFFATNKDTGVVFSATLEDVGTVKPRGCRETLEDRRRSQDLPKKDAKISESAPWVLLEYTVPEVAGQKINQRNLFACAFHDNAFIDLHFSKVSFRPGEEKLFLEILEKAEIQEGIVRSSMDYMREASAFYQQGNYKQAIPAYEKALELEKKEPKLDKKLWFVLIDNLGMAHGITGNLGRAKEIFEYGISQDSKYPLFYYNLACTYGEMGDKKNAMEQLRKSFEFRANMIPGESMPDPRTDSSFKKFMKDKDFRDLAESLVKEK